MTRSLTRPLIHQHAVAGPPNLDYTFRQRTTKICGGRERDSPTLLSELKTSARSWSMKPSRGCPATTGPKHRALHRYRAFPVSRSMSQKLPPGS